MMRRSKKFLMCITDGGNTISKFNTYILESDHVAGPWKLVVYMREFGEQAYFVNIPSKFISPDGRTAWLCYAANFSNGYLHTNYRDYPPGRRLWNDLAGGPPSSAFRQFKAVADVDAAVVAYGRGNSKSRPCGRSAGGMVY